MEHIITVLQLHNPSLSTTRLSHHAKILEKLFYLTQEKTVPLNYDWFKNEMAVWNAIVDVDNPKLYIASLVKLFPRNRNYRNAAKIDGRIRKKSFEEIERLLTDLNDDIAPLLTYDGFIGQRDYIRLQDFVIASLLSGVWIPVYRILDVASLKIRNYNRVTDNFYDGKIIAFQEPYYQEISVPPELMVALDALIRQTPYDFLFMAGEDRLPLQRFNYILRHNFGVGVTELFKIRLDQFPFGEIPDFGCDCCEVG